MPYSTNPQILNQSQTEVHSGIDPNRGQEALPALLAEDGADAFRLLKAPYTVAPYGFGPFPFGDFLDGIEDFDALGCCDCGGHCGGVGG